MSDTPINEVSGPDQGTDDLCHSYCLYAILTSRFAWHGSVQSVVAAVLRQWWDGVARYDASQAATVQQVVDAVPLLDSRLAGRALGNWAEMDGELAAGHAVMGIVQEGDLQAGLHFGHFVVDEGEKQAVVYYWDPFANEEANNQQPGGHGMAQKTVPVALMEQAEQDGPPGPYGLSIWWASGSPPAEAQQVREALHEVGVAVATINAQIGPALRTVAGAEQALHDLGVVAQSLSAQGPALESVVAALGG